MEQRDERFQAWYANIDVNVPTTEDEKLSEKLKEYIDEVAPLTSTEEKSERIKLLENLRDLLNGWVLKKLDEKHIIFEGAEGELAGRVFVSGSYRLGVDTKGSDIDTICTIPTPLTREEFFDETDGMVALLRARKEVSYVNAVIGPRVRVPLIEVVWNETELDVLCAIIPRNVVPQHPRELLDDKLLIGMDEASQITLNGPRVTELLIMLVPRTEPYTLILRCIRHWAKIRGIYSNKIGYLGGVNWAILAAFTCQLFPTAAPARLMFQFFQIYRSWRWPTEIRLCHPYEVEGLNEEQWDVSRAGGELMPIITPAYPCMNSSYTVSKYTLRTMTEEFARGERICGHLRAKNDKQMIEDCREWEQLFAKSDFFVRFSTYIVVKATCPDEHSLNRWSGWIEARIRRLMDELDRFSLEQIYPYPKKFTHEAIRVPHDPNDETLLEEQDKKKGDEAGKEQEGENQKHLRAYWYVGIKYHPINSLRSGSSIDMSAAVAQWSLAIKRWDGRTEGMDMSCSMTKWSQLPDDPALFPNGKAAAKVDHKKWVETNRRENDRIRLAAGQPIPERRKKTTETEVQNDEENGDTETKNEETENNDGETTNNDNVANDDDTTNVKKETKEQDDKTKNVVEKMQDVLAKRTREEIEVSESQKRLKNITSFHDLPPMNGIDTSEPVVFAIKQR